MNPLILEYIERPDSIPFDTDVLEYSEEQNLTVLKGSSEPAIRILSFSTSTFTKADVEKSDNDFENICGVKRLLSTSTDSRTNDEPTDSDMNRTSLINYLSTRTITEAVEPTDSDK